jgi:alanyl-tRNA synthetase
METVKLYYEDSFLADFEANVVSCEQKDDRWAVVLDRTAFYPEGGGQACDLGTLGDANVLDVREMGETVIHLCDRPLTVGADVTGKLNWDRRLDQMQQHSGEHIVSGLLCSRFSCHNVGFHVGADTVTIDFDAPIPADALAQIEEDANRAIWENLPFRCWYPDPEELKSIPYRSKKELPWPVRIVDAGGYDLCACCGVHVKQTGSVGIIKLLSCVKFHQGVRIEMVCGKRALKFLSEIYEQNRLVSQTFSAKILETGEAARKTNEALAQEKFRAAGLEKKLFALTAESYRDAGDVVLFENDLSPAAIRELADAIAQVCGGTAGVFSGSDEDGYNVCLCSKQDDLRQLGKDVNAALQGRGGGKPGFFQGSAKATKVQIEAFFKER